MAVLALAQELKNEARDAGGEPSESKKGKRRKEKEKTKSYGATKKKVEGKNERINSPGLLM